MRAALLMIAVLPSMALGQTAAPLQPYTPPPTAAPLAPLAADPTALPEDPPLGDVRVRSNDASNISSADTRSPIAPALPAPQTTADDPAAYLRAARTAIQARQTGAAQEALERAESRLLDRDVAPSDAGTRAAGPVIEQIGTARQALSVGNPQAALQAVDAALGH